MVPVITIDGPSGAGKGTVCRLVATHKSFHLLDSGALYRLTALDCLNLQRNLDSESEVAEMAKQLAVTFTPNANSTEIALNGKVVTRDIREERVGMAASKIAAYPSVRLALLERQRNFAALPGLVADGRDMGTVVFPDAFAKIFLTASAKERARRRVKQLEESNAVDIDFNQILNDIERRDLQDRTRKTAPLVPAEDAKVIDSTHLNIDEVVSQVLNFCNR